MAFTLNDFISMTLVLRFDLDIVKMNVSTENEVPSFSNAKVSEQIHRQTDLTEIITYPHVRMVTIMTFSMMYVI